MSQILNTKEKQSHYPCLSNNESFSSVWEAVQFCFTAWANNGRTFIQTGYWLIYWYKPPKYRAFHESYGCIKAIFHS